MDAGYSHLRSPILTLRIKLQEVGNTTKGMHTDYCCLARIKLEKSFAKVFPKLLSTSVGWIVRHKRSLT